MSSLVIQECGVCSQVIKVAWEQGREVARDLPSLEEHQCFDVPDGAELLVMERDRERERIVAKYQARMMRREQGKPCGCQEEGH